ncbi:MAG: gliding motility protein GldN [Bacteroidia bacterium]|nr:gliding motility protein GldN [Bacteroidia bacterium]
MNKYQKLGLLLILIIGVTHSSFSQVLDATPRDGVFDKSAIVELQPIPNVYLREADIVWTKRIWRTVDMREKMNLPYYYPEKPQAGWKSLVQVLMDGLREGIITAYSSDNDEFLYPITHKEVMDKVKKAEAVTLRRETGEEYDTLLTKEFYTTDVKRFLIKEDWYFDKMRSVFEVRILGISPLMESFTETGERRPDQQLFWVYFPECRNVFAHSEIFNMKNGSAGRLSYDDAFTKRIFASYITKFENVYDRQINQYATGVDALLESERAKNQIFEFEQGLWEY